jgi:hypothetical protein
MMYSEIADGEIAHGEIAVKQTTTTPPIERRSVGVSTKRSSNHRSKVAPIFVDISFYILSIKFS